VKNVTTPPPRTIMAPNVRRNQLIVLGIIVLLFLVLVRACSGHENRYEHIARELNEAVQKNDYNAVAKLENSETVAEMGHGRLGQAADLFAPLGAIKSVKEDTTKGDAPRVHEFDVTFAKAIVHEKILFDPEDKIARFAYDPIKPNP
jgi:hypothetical protein